MALIKIKRGPSSNITSLNLEAGEPAFTTDAGKLYIGNGDGKVLINPDITNVGTADKLTTARTIALSGDATASGSFDGSGNLTLVTTLANSGVAVGTYTKLTVDAKGRVTSATTLSASDIPTLTLSKISDAGTAASKSTGTASGNVPILGTDGKLDSAVLPAIAITDTFVVASQTAMLALSSAEVGDIAVRTDVNKSYILKATGYSTLANWQELLTPTDTVLSVNGKTGAVTITLAELGGLASSSYTAADILTKLMTVDGTGSGLDADLLDGKEATAFAPTSHGNHVPAIETANNARFLRNDNSWQTVTPANISAEPAIAAGTTSQYLRGDKTWQTMPTGNVTHTGEVTGAAALTITAKAVTNAKLADMAANTIKGVGNTTGTPVDLTVEQVKTMLGYLTASDTIDGGSF